MNDLKTQLLAFWNESRRKEHTDLLNDPVRLERLRKYAWFTEAYPEPQDEWFGWSEIVGEIEPVELNGYSFKSYESIGGEGQGDQMHWIFSITDPEGNVQYWRKNGYWVSHDGAYWEDDEPYKVTPKTRQVVYYE